MRWIEWTVHPAEGKEEELYGILVSRFGIDTMAVEDSTLLDDIAIYQDQWNEVDETLAASLAGGTTIKFYTPSEEAPKAAVIQETLAPYIAEPLSLAEVDEEDWANSWKRYYEVTPIGHHLVVVPSWIPYQEKPGDIVITLDPGMAFGTGTHETTALCAVMIEESVKEGDRVYDIGTGSGILAIVAAKCGASQVVGVDIDPMCVKVARENAAINGVGGTVTIMEGDLFNVLEGKADLVVTNIIAEVIVGMVAGLKTYIAPCGHAIFSGIIVDKIPMVHQALVDAGYGSIQWREQGDWAAVRAEVGR